MQPVCYLLTISIFLSVLFQHNASAEDSKTKAIEASITAVKAATDELIPVADDLNEAKDFTVLVLKSFEQLKDLRIKSATSHDEWIKATKEYLEADDEDKEAAKLMMKKKSREMSAIKHERLSILAWNRNALKKIRKIMSRREDQEAIVDLLESLAKAIETMPGILPPMPDTEENDANDPEESASSGVIEAKPPVAPSEAMVVNWKPDLFARLPLFNRLEMGESISDFQLPIDTAASSDLAWNCSFDSPAHFPRYEFSSLGERFDTRGALIYEGMQFSMEPSGRFQVHFLLGTPNLPVTVRLQLSLMKYCEERNVFRQVGTITIPPITIPAVQRVEHEFQSQPIHQVYEDTYRIYWEGNVPPSYYLAFDKIERSGTARFGFGVDIP